MLADLMGQPYTTEKEEVLARIKAFDFSGISSRKHLPVPPIINGVGLQDLGTNVSVHCLGFS